MASTPGRNALELELDANHEPTQFEQFVSIATVGELENAVKLGAQRLFALEQLFAVASGANDARKLWIEKIQELREATKPARIVIGVVGGTGAGKSSLINAVLDEERLYCNSTTQDILANPSRLLPTSGMRACTASATEVSFNYSDDPAQLYRAEVEFITEEDWCKELKILLDELLDGNGQVSVDYNKLNTEAGRAFSKVKAVYPTKGKEVIAKSTPSSLAREPDVNRVLGSTTYLAESTASALYTGLQRYVDSKERLAETGDEMELWPLIKVVRIYCKASALSTGAVLVDLPGVQDSNAARAAVAESYMKACSGIWITAAIQRAVDEKAAKELLGGAFRRQLKFDGSFSAVTFICSKSDDILQREVNGLLDGTSEIVRAQEARKLLQQEHKRLLLQSQERKDRKAAIKDQIEDADNRIEVWEELLAKFKAGATVYRPLEDFGRKKRKRTSGRTSQRKRVDLDERGDDSTDSSDYAETSEDEIQASQESNQEGQAPLTDTDIEGELVKIKSEKKALRSSMKPVQAEIKELKEKERQHAKDEKALHSEIIHMCIKRRNEYARSAIKKDFAMGIKELDQEAAMEEDESAFNPDQVSRNYEEVAQKLPVFCISARAWQKLSGNMEDETVHVNGFISPHDTEIPALQEHARKMTEAGRVSEARRCLNDINELLSSIRLWETGSIQIGLSDEDRIKNETFLEARFADLKASFTAAEDVCIDAIRKALEQQLYGFFENLIPIGVAKAVQTASKWGACKDEGGTHFNTYKAICRRLGAFGTRDFNADLFEPISRGLARPWERLFQESFADALDEYVSSCKRKINRFHQNIILSLPKQPGNNEKGWSSLHGKLRTYHASVEFRTAALRPLITETQRNASRAFVPVIQEAMGDAYKVCAAERGNGSYLRMKEAMVNHVEASRHYMFRRATDAVKKELEALRLELQRLVAAAAADNARTMERDYKTVLAGKDQVEAERKLRDEMRRPLEDAELWLAGLLHHHHHHHHRGAASMDNDVQMTDSPVAPLGLGGAAHPPGQFDFCREPVADSSARGIKRERDDD